MAKLQGGTRRYREVEGGIGRYREVQGGTGRCRAFWCTEGSCSRSEVGLRGYTCMSRSRARGGFAGRASRGWGRGASELT
eukprot:1196299-Prorocentrum_minimum.AAC.6